MGKKKFQKITCQNCQAVLAEAAPVPLDTQRDWEYLACFHPECVGFEGPDVPVVTPVPPGLMVRREYEEKFGTGPKKPARKRNR